MTDRFDKWAHDMVAERSPVTPGTIAAALRRARAEALEESCAPIEAGWARNAVQRIMGALELTGATCAAVTEAECIVAALILRVIRRREKAEANRSEMPNSSLRWTRDRPTEPGWWWCWFDESPKPEAAEVFRSGGELCVAGLDETGKRWHASVASCEGFRWAGPIAPPEEAAQ